MNGTSRPGLRRLTPILLGIAGVVGGCAGHGMGPGTRAGISPRDAAPTDALIPVNGTRLFVHREGAGEAVLVVHGGPVLDHGYLVEPLRPLSDDYELIFYDQRLSGRSEGTVDSASVTLETFVADIEGIRRSLGLERIHLVGHSWGGLLALKYALAHPARLRSLVLVSPMAPSAELWQREEAAATAALEPADTAGLGALRASAAVAAREPAAIERLLQLSFRSQLHDRDRAAELRFHIPDDYAARSRQFGFMMPDLSSYDVVDRLPHLRVPTLLVYGDSEAGAPIGARALRERVPDLTVRVIEAAGHFAFMERPEPFRRVLRAFLRER